MSRRRPTCTRSDWGKPAFSGVVGFVATLLLRDRTGIPLGPDHEAEQAKSPIYGASKV